MNKDASAPRALASRARHSAATGAILVRRAPAHVRCRLAAPALAGCRLVFAACVSLLALASAPSFADAGSDLAANRDRWATAAIADYEYGYNKYCECHRDDPPETIVTVHEGQVTRVRHKPVGYDREVEAPRGLEYYWTVDGLFDLIATAIDKRAEVRASYDSELGYPTEIHVDYDRDLIGDEVDLRITRLDRLAPER